MRIVIHIGRDEVLGYMATMGQPKPNIKIYMYLLSLNSSYPSPKKKRRTKQKKTALSPKKYK
jgi:hypothetical protein